MCVWSGKQILKYRFGSFACPLAALHGRARMVMLWVKTQNCVLGLHVRIREVMENLAAENSATKSPSRVREVMGKNPK